jgi:hypothetical protein
MLVLSRKLGNGYSCRTASCRSPWSRSKSNTVRLGIRADRDRCVPQRALAEGLFGKNGESRAQLERFSLESKPDEENGDWRPPGGTAFYASGDRVRPALPVRTTQLKPGQDQRGRSTAYCLLRQCLPMGKTHGTNPASLGYRMPAEWEPHAAT